MCQKIKGILISQFMTPLNLDERRVEIQSVQKVVLSPIFTTQSSLLHCKFFRNSIFCTTEQPIEQTCIPHSLVFIGVNVNMISTPTKDPLN